MIHKLMSTMRRVEWEPRISRAVLPSSASAVRHVHAFREILGDFPKMLCIFEWKKESRREIVERRDLLLLVEFRNRISFLLLLRHFRCVTTTNSSQNEHECQVQAEPDAIQELDNFLRHFSSIRLSTHISLQFITRPIADQTTWTELLCVALVGVGVVNDSATATGSCAAH